jgi:hypothetical protein
MLWENLVGILFEPLCRQVTRTEPTRCPKATHIIIIGTCC